MQERISKEELALADLNLKRFVQEYEILYGKCNMTMNVHSLLHVSQCVESLGPLWAYSMFSFESFNGTLKKYAKSPNNVIHQVTESIVINFNSSFKITKERKSEILGNEINVRLSILDSIVLRQHKIFGSMKFFSTMKRGSIKFTSTNYFAAKITIDYFVRTNDNKYGKVKYYIENDSAIYVLIDEYSTEQYIDHILLAKPRSMLILKPAKDIAEKCIYMKIRTNELIARRPNKFEVN